MKFTPFITILRPVNLLLLALAVALGFWLGQSPGGPATLALLAAAAICAAGFGNVVNDIADVATDAISHPKRPLVTGSLARSAAIVYAAFLAIASCGLALCVSWIHCLGAAVPLFLLLSYAFFFKATPLTGNVLVSVMVAYGILFGAMRGIGLHRLFLPALLAFLLNLSREIVKDVQDSKGDTAAGLVTSAFLPEPALKIIVGVCGGLYALLVFLPWILRDFGLAYGIACFAAVAPLHVRWTFLLFKKGLFPSAAAISLLIKYEMLAGLAAMALDGLAKYGSAS